MAAVGTTLSCQSPCDVTAEEAGHLDLHLFHGRAWEGRAQQLADEQAMKIIKLPIFECAAGRAADSSLSLSVSATAASLYVEDILTASSLLSPFRGSR